MMVRILSLFLLFLALRALLPRRARAELAQPGRVTIHTRPDHWLYSLERHPRALFDLPYAGEASTPEQKLHIVYPDAGEGPFPVVVFIHGGGWSLFNSENHRIVYTGEMPLNALSRGYAVAYADYRLNAPQIMPHQLYDVKAAVRFLRANAAEYSLIPDQIVLTGDSAGAHLADLAALTADEPEFEDVDRIYPEISCAVQAVVSWFGITDFSGEMSELLGWFYGLDSAGLTVEDIARLSRLCSPVHNVAPGKAPPFYLQHGLEDSETPYTQSCDLYNALMTISPHPMHRLELFPGMEHAVTWFMTSENMGNVLDWMDGVLGRG